MPHCDADWLGQMQVVPSQQPTQFAGPQLAGEPLLDPELPPLLDPKPPLLDPELPPPLDPELPLLPPENPPLDPENPPLDPEGPLLDPERPLLEPEGPPLDPDAPLPDAESLPPSSFVVPRICERPQPRIRATTKIDALPRRGTLCRTLLILHPSWPHVAPAVADTPAPCRRASS